MNQKFNKSKYTNWYHNIIDRAKSQHRRKGDIYYERHHILPRALGGDNSKENLVLLTAREHYICHLLLPKMCDGGDKARMVYTLMRLSSSANRHRQRYNSKLYHRMKHAYVKHISGENSYMYGVSKTKEYRRKISETRKRLGLSKGKNNPMYGKQHTDESLKRMSENSKGKTSGKKNGMYGKKRPDLSKRNLETNIRHEVGQYDKQGNLITTYPHAAEAAKAVGAKNYRNISYLAKNFENFPNRTAYGFKWRYV